jgi:hypothetical protein
VRAVHGCTVLSALAALAACGHGSSQGGLPVSGTDVSCGASMYISNGACVALPPFSDASVQLDEGDAATDGEASSDAGPPAVDGGPDDSGDSSVDGPSDAGDDAPSLDPLAPCEVASDVFYVHAAYAIDAPGSSQTFTNLDAIFQAGAPPPLHIVATPSGEPPTVLVVALTNDSSGPAGAPTAPGTYETGAGGIFVSLDLNGVDVGYDEGTVTLEDEQIVESEGGPSRLHSLLLTYSLVSSGVQTISGCVRYIDSDGGP